MVEPTVTTKWDDNETNVSNVTTTREDDGWIADGNNIFERPSAGVFNRWMNNVYKWITYLNTTVPTTGTFTPSVADADTGGNVASTTTAVGTYTVVGDIVLGHIELGLIDPTGLTGANAVYILGFPVVINEDAIAPVLLDRVTISGEYVVAKMISGASSTAASLQVVTTAAAETEILVSDLQTASVFSSISFNFQYKIEV